MARKRVKDAYGKRKTIPKKEKIKNSPIQKNFKKTVKKVEKAIRDIEKSAHRGKVPAVDLMRKYYMKPTKNEKLAKERIKQMKKFLRKSTLKDLEAQRKRFEDFLSNYAGVDVTTLPGYDYWKFKDFFNDIQQKLGIKYQESELVNDLWTARDKNIDIFAVMEKIQQRDEDFSTIYDDFKPSARRKKAYDYSAFKRNAAYHRVRK